MFLRPIQDLEAIEHVPLAARPSVRSTYELIREAATQDPERRAIAFPSGGDRLRLLHYPGEKVFFYPLIFYVHIFKYVLIRPHHVQGAG
jgi:hypothetical protein